MRSQHVLIAGMVLLAAVAGRAADPPAPGGAPEVEKVDAAVIWPASLERVQGRYAFAQVASPGGLWRSGGGSTRQVSIHELSAASRERLEKAEIVISDLRLPTEKEASSRLSPSKRGYLRYYQEHAPGRLVMRGLPGIGGEHADSGTYSGPVEFELSHASHSNPSVSGVLNQRRQQEATWGVATMDYADFSATPILAGAKPEDEPIPILGNARILRSGVEIFAYVNWTEKGPDGTEHLYRGAVRLAREDQRPPQPPPPARRGAEVASAR